MRERGVWVEREVCKMSLRFTKRKKVHILKTLDQRDLAYNSDDFPVPNVVAYPIEISFVLQRFWRICKKNSVMQAFILIGCIKSTFFLNLSIQGLVLRRFQLAVVFCYQN